MLLGFNIVSIQVEYTHDCDKNIFLNQCEFIQLYHATRTSFSGWLIFFDINVIVSSSIRYYIFSR